MGIEGGKPDPIPAATPDDQPQHTLKLFKASDESGNLEVTEVASGKDVTEDKLDTNDVFILDAGHTIYVWIGKGASAQERKMPPDRRRLCQEGGQAGQPEHCARHGGRRERDLPRQLPEGVSAPLYTSACAATAPT